MYPCNESRAGPGNELAPHAFPCAEPPRAVFSSPGCSGQESQNGTAPTTSTTNAVMPPWNSTTSSSVGSWVRSAGAVGKDISIEQIQDELEGFRYSEFSSQQKTAYMRGDSGFTNIFPAINENSCSGQKSFYPCRGFLNGDENSEAKLHDIGSSSWNPETLGLIAASPQTASNFYYDTGVKSRIETTSFLPQGNLIQTAVTNPVSTDNMDLFQGMEATEDNETHIFMCPGEKIFIPRSDDNSCPNHDKGKIVQDSLWDSNWTAEHHHLKDYHFGGNKSSVQNVSESAVISTNLLKFFCPEYTVGCHHVVSYPYPCLDVKELEEKEWTKLLQKELTNSDVGSLGRIVLPKKEAEANLPALLERDGLVLEMVDMANHVVWGFKYRFWPNNRSRMYILENTGDFAKMNKLEIGDSLVIYGDRTSRYYLVGVEKKATREKMIRGNGVIDQPREDANKVRSSERQRR